jgi:hypothetical protein
MIRKLLVASALTLCAGLYVAELSGHWDQTLRDANDEAGFIAIVLCVGAAIGSVAAFVARVLPPRRRWFRALLPVRLDRFRHAYTLPSPVNTGPPVNLRV